MAAEVPSYIGFRITEQCSAGPACIARCFSQEQELFADPPLSTVYTVLRHLKDSGVKTVNIMGGEPTQRTDLPLILAFAHNDLGLDTVLSTNAMPLTPELLDEMEPHLTWLSLSLDADTKSFNDALRGKGQWDAAHRAAHWFGQKDRSVGWKVNTQVTALNVNNIGGIPDSLGKPQVWKLLQWTPRAKAALVTDRYAITPEMYNNAVGALRERYPDVCIVERPYPETEPDTGIIRPDGTFEINARPHEYVVIGNILMDDPSELFRKAGVVYEQFAPENAHEFHKSYHAKGREKK